MRIPPISAQLSPLGASLTETFNRLACSLSDEQTAWLIGYITALNYRYAESGQPRAASTQGELSSKRKLPLQVLYASQTGNAEKVAKRLASEASALGFEVTLKSVADVRPNKLSDSENLIFITSTQGDGEPPESAREFMNQLQSKRAPNLSKVHFSVLALGDSSYPKFCRAGVVLDQRLEELGGKRLLPRVDCDVDYAEAAAAWQKEVLTAYRALLAPASHIDEGQTVESVVTASLEYDSERPFQAELLERIQLNGKGSAKETVHLELSLANSQMRYAPGDALGVIAPNSPEYVSELLTVANLPRDCLVRVGGEELPLEQALIERFEVTSISKRFLQAYLKLVPCDTLLPLVENGAEEKLAAFSKGREIIDVLNLAPPRGLSAQEFIGTLRRQKPRYYSIASSLLAHEDEVHLLVGVTRYTSEGRRRLGVCSTYLGDRAELGGKIPVFAVSNPNFKLPSNPNTPIIMVGPGTGVAPFRAFLEERQTLGCPGKNWLFFGDQHFETDFLYQAEWLRFKKQGLLTRLDVAFSRDTAEKVYVQHRMLEQSREIYRWLEEGANFYVCGDASRMAVDVHEALITIIGREGGKSRELAEAYLDELHVMKRYQRDVY